jgi:uncharacterized membrane protein
VEKKQSEKTPALEDEFSIITKDSFGEKIGNVIIEFASSWVFLVLNIAFFSVWLLSGLNFDLLTMWVSLEAIVLTVLILIQNKHVEKSDRNRSIKDYKIDVSTAKRLKRMESKLDELVKKETSN